MVTMIEEGVVEEGINYLNIYKYPLFTYGFSLYVNIFFNEDQEYENGLVFVIVKV